MKFKKTKQQVPKDKLEGRLEAGVTDEGQVVLYVGDQIRVFEPEMAQKFACGLIVQSAIAEERKMQLRAKAFVGNRADGIATMQPEPRRKM